MIQIAFEEDEVRAGQVQEEIRRFAVQLPERVASTPERVLFVNPFALTFVLLKGTRT